MNTSSVNMPEDGLNTTRYQLERVRTHRLYTEIAVRLFGPTGPEDLGDDLIRNSCIELEGDPGVNNSSAANSNLKPAFRPLQTRQKNFYST